jgi:hypothetical protein
MNKFTAVAVLVAVAVTIVAPVGFGVNTPSVNKPTVWADGSGSPIPPMPVLLADGSGSPIPPMPVLFEETGRAEAHLGSSARG